MNSKRQKTREFLLALAEEVTNKSGDGLQKRSKVSVKVGENTYSVASPVMEKDVLKLSATDFDALLQKFFPNAEIQEALPVVEWEKQVYRIITEASKDNPLRAKKPDWSYYVPETTGIFFQDKVSTAIIYAKVMQKDGSYFVFDEPKPDGRIIYKCDAKWNPVWMVKKAINGDLIDKKWENISWVPYSPKSPLTTAKK